MARGERAQLSYLCLPMLRQLPAATLLELCVLAGDAGCKSGIAAQPDDTVWGTKRRGRKPNIKLDRAKPAEGDASPVIDILAEELQGNLVQLQRDDLEVKAYFLGYDLTALEELWIVAEDGALVRD